MENNIPLLSIIIPVYNTASTLRRCFESVCKQTYKNLEIILIDDGSTDGADKIVDQYAKKDVRIKTVHQQNAGESVARNIGLRQVTGEYFTFVDCDDWLELDMYEKMMLVAVQDDVDIVACSWYKDYDENSEEITNKGKVTTEIFNREQLLMYIYQRDQYRGFTYMWNKIYRRSLMYDEKGEIIDFPENLAIGGDVVYLARMALNACSAKYINRAYYHYYQRMDSGCHSNNLKKRLDWIQSYCIVISYIKEHNIETAAVPWLERFLAYHASNVAELAFKQNDQEVLEKCHHYMRKYQSVYEQTNQEYPERIERFRIILGYML
ncbi:Glycosyltransferase involved in cell wall bisynthesis [Pseudobutyrivibrio sp. C4]|uniref:glycosyltransferase n=1 Tax=Pseudobutyrivibrio sp. C4 TaxID=1520803 RepID=UPI0008B4EC01|nr:glycosyltransferase [Pseudobutyrivibrio sp. C4]SET25484.1 Glycosyltransferase involved in cell wall bisynthesis [Pseudobutyrivibrio sp. C4]